MENELEENNNNNNNNDNNNIGLKVKNIFFWGLAIFLWLIGAVGLSERKDILFSVLAIILGIFACPRSSAYLKKYEFYTKYKTWIIIGTFILWFISPSKTETIPNSDNNILNSNSNVSINEEISTQNTVEEPKVEEKKIVDTTNKISLEEIPEFKDKPYVEINGNVPFFDDSELTTTNYEKYSELDNLGRVGIATACIGVGMDDQARDNIKSVTPTAWKDTKYNGIDGSNLYNRCHLIAFQLTGENANEKNLMTGTRYMNTQGMERFENQVSEYVNHTEKHVLYRVTPMFKGDNLLANGVLMEAKSVEDNGSGIQFNVFCYNVQPGIELDYKTGDSKKIEEEKSKSEIVPASSVVAPAVVESVTSSNVTPKESTSSPETPVVAPSTSPSNTPATTPSTEATYVLNKNSKKFHHSWCSSVNQMKEKNKEYSNSSRDEIIARGYQPCQRCSP